MSLGDDFKKRCHKQRQKEESHNAKKRKEYQSAPKRTFAPVSRNIERESVNG